MNKPHNESFANRLRAALPGIRMQGTEPLAILDYAEELKARSNVWHSIFSRTRNIGALKPILPSPQPRNYRTTSRRRVEFNRGRLRLLTATGIPTTDPGTKLERSDHTQLFESVAALVSSGKSKDVISFLQHIIVRGQAPDLVLILNVAEISSGMIRTAKGWERRLREQGAGSLWLYVDPSGSDFYLEHRRPKHGVTEKKIFGARAYTFRIGELEYQAGVFNFSQVNLPILPALLSTVEAEILPSRDATLFDLYSGYGLFGTWLHRYFREVHAVDSDKAAVGNALYNIRRAGGRARITAGRITPSLVKGLDIQSGRDVVIADPPRIGLTTPVIKAIAECKPAQVIVLYCGIDVVPSELMTWQRNGYNIKSMMPVDMFPGTLSIETIVTLVPRS